MEARAEVAVVEREVVQALVGREMVQICAVWFDRRSGGLEADCTGGRQHWRKRPPIPWR